MTTNVFEVHALFHGDYPELAERLLKSLRKGPSSGRICSFHFGFNAAGEATRNMVRSFIRDYGAGVPSSLYRAHYDVNVGKYPMMRAMFAHQAGSLGAGVRENVLRMWFDDDSYLREEAAGDSYWWRVVAAMAGEVDLLGAVYKQRWREHQKDWIRRQPWYASPPAVELGSHAVFATGGWWVANPGLLRVWDYPFPWLHHRGGDTMLGELVRQCGGSLYSFRDGVAINADEMGRESQAKRRGIDEPPAAADGEPVPTETPRIFRFVGEGLGRE